MIAPSPELDADTALDITPAPPSASRIRPFRLALVSALLFAVFAWPQLVVLPFLPFVPAGDEVLWLVDGDRINHGQVIYRDFFEVTFPGTQYFYALAQRAFGPNAWIPILTYLLLGAITAALLFAISRRVLPGRLPALVVGLYLVGPFFLIPDATHHWFAAVFIYIALWALLRSNSRKYLAFAGACCALATFFMQTKGVLAVVAVAAYLVFRNRKSSVRPVLFVLGSFAVTLSGLLAPAVACAGLRRFFYNTVTFVSTSWGTEFFDTWRVYGAFPPAHSSWTDIPGVIAYLLVFGSVPLVYVVFFTRYLRLRTTDSSQSWDELLLIAMVGAALFLAVVQAPSKIRLASGSAPAMVLLVFLISGRSKVERLLLRFTVVAVAVLAVACPLARQFQWHSALDTRIGRVDFNSPAWRDTVAPMLSILPAGQPCFGNHVACYLAGDYVVGPVNYILPSDYTTPAQVDQIIRDLERYRVPKLVLRAIFYLPIEPGAHDHLGPFRAYVFSHYRFEEMLPNTDEIWIRDSDDEKQH